MGLDQWIVRNSNGETPSIDENGKWINATECIKLRSDYWLRNHLNPVVQERCGKNITDMCMEFIPIEVEDLEDVIEDSKTCLRERETWVAMDLFDTGLFYSNHDFDWFIAKLGYFNRVMCNRLRSKKETHYWYIESW